METETAKQPVSIGQLYIALVAHSGPTSMSAADVVSSVPAPTTPTTPISRTSSVAGSVGGESVDSAVLSQESEQRKLLKFKKSLASRDIDIGSRCPISVCSVCAPAAAAAAAAVAVSCPTATRLCVLSFYLIFSLTYALFRCSRVAEAV